KLLVDVHKKPEKEGKMLIEFIDKCSFFLAAHRYFCKNRNRWRFKKAGASNGKRLPDFDEQSSGGPLPGKVVCHRL
ncbi:MAG: hypothetical protein Q3X94_04680, partial [Oscillospiraceae bacterium]|nr:hypothetical protein [Oscillospiraceae bacterium]